MYGPGSRGLFAPNMDFLSVSLLILGLGSFAFHATLRQTMQFADELSMLGLGWSMLIAVFTVRKPTLQDKLIKAACAVFFPAFAVFYVQSGEIVYHATAFFIILTLIVARCQYLFYFHKSSFPAQKMCSWAVRGQWAIITLLVGYALWHMDLELCAQFRAIRAHVGYPWAFLLEPHGWWHILTAVSASVFMDIMREMQVEMIKAEEAEEQRAALLAALLAALALQAQQAAEDQMTEEQLEQS